MLKEYKVAHYGWDCQKHQWFYFNDESYIRPKPWWPQGDNSHLEIWEQWKDNNVLRVVQTSLLIIPNNISYYP